MIAALNRLAERRDPSIFDLVQVLKRSGLIDQPVTSVAGSTVCINGREIINFTSSNYLGLASHPAVRRAAGTGAKDWGISTSQPRLWTTDSLTARLERVIAGLVGQERALIFPSTSQLALDVLPLLAGKHGLILIDELAYPISHAGAQAACQRGARMRTFRHNDPDDLARSLQQESNLPDKVIVCDGVYMPSGETAKLPAFQRLAGEFNAVIYVDDAQGIGLVGRNPLPAAPYGTGGGGILQYWRIKPGRVLYASTLAKAIGIPLAFVAGPAGFIDFLASTAFTQLHSSPPALPLLAACLTALKIHSIQGDRLRTRLLSRIHYFQEHLRGLGRWPVSDHLYPMQTVYFPSPGKVLAVARHLRRTGVWPVVQFHPPDYPIGGALRFVLTALHTRGQLNKLIHSLAYLAPSVAED